jgi:uncharacterized protein YkwD
MTPLRRLLTVAAVGCAFAAVAAPANAACPGASTAPTAGNLPTVKAATLCLLNERRAHAGIGPLARDAALENAANRYTARMVAERFFAHLAPDGSSPLDRLIAAGLSFLHGSAIGENLGYGQGGLETPGSMVQMWMDSPGHRANILTGAFRAIGIGVAIGTPQGTPYGATYATEFATSVKPKPKAKKKKAKKRKACRKKRGKRRPKSCRRHRRAAR